MTVKTEWHGDAALARIVGAARESLGELNQEAADAARGEVPVKTGELRDSITATPDGVEALGRGVYLETGTSRTAPRPWLTPAMLRTFTLRKMADKMRSKT